MQGLPKTLSRFEGRQVQPKLIGTSGGHKQYDISIPDERQTFCLGSRNLRDPASVKAKEKLPASSPTNALTQKSKAHRDMLSDLTNKVKVALKKMLAAGQSAGGYSQSRQIAKSKGYKDIAGLRKAFRRIDTNGNGIIDKFELRDGLQKLGVETTAYEQNLLFEIFDSDGNDGIDFSEFCSMLLGGERLNGTASTLANRYTEGLEIVGGLC